MRTVLQSSSLPSVRYQISQPDTDRLVHGTFDNFRCATITVFLNTPVHSQTSETLPSPADFPAARIEGQDRSCPNWR
jgi:hypothetical protein